MPASFGGNRVKGGIAHKSAGKEGMDRLIVGIPSSRSLVLCLERPRLQFLKLQGT